MALIDQALTQKLLGNRFQDIWEIVHGGWIDYQERYSQKERLIHSANTRACIVHDHQVARASQYAFINQFMGVRLVSLSKLSVLLVDDLFAIRFKKLDTEKKSSNQPTKQVISFKSQEQLEGLPITHNLEAGYILSSNDQIEEISLVCPNGTKKKPYWAIRLENGLATTITSDIFIAGAGQNAASDDEVAIVPKKPKSNIIQMGKLENQDDN